MALIMRVVLGVYETVMPVTRLYPPPGMRSILMLSGLVLVQMRLQGSRMLVSY